MTATQTIEYEPAEFRVEQPTLLGQLIEVRAGWRERSRARRLELARSEEAWLRAHARERT